MQEIFCSFKVFSHVGIILFQSLNIHHVDHNLCVTVY